jgi:hypothetical protein
MQALEERTIDAPATRVQLVVLDISELPPECEGEWHLLAVPTGVGGFKIEERSGPALTNLLTDPPPPPGIGTQVLMRVVPSPPEGFWDDALWSDEQRAAWRARLNAPIYFDPELRTG